MVLFAVAHAVHLQDGVYAIRSPEFPGCEARHARVELAREQFGEVLRERLLQMIEAGQTPGLYTYEELGSSFAGRCTVQISAPDRMPGTFDRVMAVRAKLPPGTAERVRSAAATPQHETPASEPESSPTAAAEPAQDTSAPEDATRGRLGPSARLAVVAARLAARDRNLD